MICSDWVQTSLTRAAGCGVALLGGRDPVFCGLGEKGLEIFSLMGSIGGWSGGAADESVLRVGSCKALPARRGATMIS
jgi:hypothetical protein